MKRFKLSNSEEILMDTLWRENRPLTTLQLAEKVTEASWNTNYIDKLLGQLVKKGMVQVSGLLQNGEHARGARRESGTVCPNRRGAVQKTCQIKRIRAGRKADCRAGKNGRSVRSCAAEQRREIICK